ncbi:MAG: hypothetical protein AAF581_17845 [Planctomycetota bacterium]
MTPASQHPDLASLSLFYDGEGAQEFLDGIEEHLRSCDACRAELAKFAGLTKTLQEAPDLAAPPSVLDGVRAGMQLEAAPPPLTAPTSPPRWWSGAAAAVVLVGIAFVSWRMNKPPVEVALKSEAPASESPTADSANDKRTKDDGEEALRLQKRKHGANYEPKSLRTDTKTSEPPGAVVLKLDEQEALTNDEVRGHSSQTLSENQRDIVKEADGDEWAFGDSQSESPPQPQLVRPQPGVNARAGAGRSGSVQPNQRERAAPSKVVGAPTLDSGNRAVETDSPAFEANRPAAEDPVAASPPLPPVVRFFSSLEAAPDTPVDLYVQLPARLDALTLERSLTEALLEEHPPQSLKPSTVGSGMGLMAAPPRNRSTFRTLEISVDRQQLPHILEVARQQLATAAGGVRQGFAPKPGVGRSGESLQEDSTLGDEERDERPSIKKKKSTKKRANETEASREATAKSPAPPAVVLPPLPESGRIRIRILLPSS